MKLRNIVRKAIAAPVRVTRDIAKGAAEGVNDVYEVVVEGKK